LPRDAKGSGHGGAACCNVAWKSGSMPMEWQTGVVVPIFKKGDRRVCSYYRGMALLSLPGKVYSRLLERKLRPIVEPQVSGGAVRFTSYRCIFSVIGYSGPSVVFDHLAQLDSAHPSELPVSEVLISTRGPDKVSCIEQVR